MEVTLIILFFILILILTSSIEIDIQKLEIINNKIKFFIKFKIAILKNIVIFSKKIKKKDIIKFLDFSQKKNHLEQERKFINTLPIKLTELNLKLDYGIKAIFINTYGFAIINTIIPIFINKFSNNKTKVNYEIKSNFKQNYIYVNISSKFRIDIIQLIKRKIIEKSLKKEKSMKKDLQKRKLIKI